MDIIWWGSSCPSNSYRVSDCQNPSKVIPGINVHRQSSYLHAAVIHHAANRTESCSLDWLLLGTEVLKSYSSPALMEKKSWKLKKQFSGAEPNRSPTLWTSILTVYGSHSKRINEFIIQLCNKRGRIVNYNICSSGSMDLTNYNTKLSMR